MARDLDKIEERTAELLGQIQASVAEYVRTMNEAGALRRREADEAHRQQDEAIMALKAIQLQASATVEAHSKLAARLGNEWLGLVERGLQKAIMTQAEAASRALVLELNMQQTELTAAVRDAIGKVSQLAERNERICRSLAWKTIAVSVGWLMFVAFCFRGLVF